MRQKRNTRKPGGVYLPTQAQIREACKLIRAGWSERELRRRAVGPQRVRWSIPECRQADIDDSGEGGIEEDGTP